MSKLVFLFVWFLVWPKPSEVHYWDMMDQAVSNKDIAEKFLVKVKHITVYDDALLVGFKAMSEFLICNHRTNPLNKLSHFREGRKLLEQAIDKAPSKPELRYFRYSTQVSIPGFLNYHSDIAQDKSFLINYLRKQENAGDKTLAKRIKTFMITNKGCTSEERNAISKLKI